MGTLLDGWIVELGHPSQLEQRLICAAAGVAYRVGMW